MRGLGVPSDITKAFQWFRLAAEQGHARAQSNVGVFYQNGLGVPQDDIKAFQWFRRWRQNKDLQGRSTALA